MPVVVCLLSPYWSVDDVKAPFPANSLSPSIHSAPIFGFGSTASPLPLSNPIVALLNGVAVISAKNHKRQRRKRQSVTAIREKSQTPKVLTAILTLPNLT